MSVVKITVYMRLYQVECFMFYCQVSCSTNKVVVSSVRGYNLMRDHSKAYGELCYVVLLLIML